MPSSMWLRSSTSVAGCWAPARARAQHRAAGPADGRNSHSALRKHRPAVPGALVAKWLNEGRYGLTDCGRRALAEVLFFDESPTVADRPIDYADVRRTSRVSRPT